MSHYIIELALWILLAYFIGCVIGWLLHSLFVGEEIAAPREAAPVTPRQPEPVPMQPAVPDVVATEPEADVAAIIEHPIPVAGMPRRMERPKGLEQAREGKPDDLQRISGIGPKNEKILHTLGFFHFFQAFTDFCFGGPVEHGADDGDGDLDDFKDQCDQRTGCVGRYRRNLLVQPFNRCLKNSNTGWSQR